MDLSYWTAALGVLWESSHPIPFKRVLTGSSQTIAKARKLESDLLKALGPKEVVYLETPKSSKTVNIYTLKGFKKVELQALLFIACSITEKICDQHTI